MIGRDGLGGLISTAVSGGVGGVHRLVAQQCGQPLCAGLGDQIEVNLVRAIMTDPSPWLFLTRPISGALIALSVASVALAVWQHHRTRARLAKAPALDVDF